MVSQGCQGVAALRRQLQKSFRLVQQTVDSLEAQIPQSTDLLLSICNLCEQFECCKAVQFETTALRIFPNVKTRLLLKISGEIREKADKLRAILLSQEKFCQKISKQRQTISDLYTKYSSQMDLDTLVRRSATEPSVADMMEWLLDTDTRLHQQCYCKKHLLEILRDGDCKTAGDLQTTCSQDERVLLSHIQKYLDQVSLFLKEDL